MSDRTRALTKPPKPVTDGEKALYRRLADWCEVETAAEAKVDYGSDREEGCASSGWVEAMDEIAAYLREAAS